MAKATEVCTVQPGQQGHQLVPDRKRKTKIQNSHGFDCEYYCLMESDAV